MFQAIISTDALDRDGEIVAREAFASSMGKTIPLIQSHDWGSLPVGKGVVGQNAEGTTLSGSFFLDTTAGAEAYKTAKNMSDLQEFSVGFMPLASDMVLVDGKNVRKITDMELFEASLVLVGASRGTRLSAIKTAEAEAMTVEKALDFLEAELKAGRSMNQGNLDQMHNAMTQMDALHASTCDMGDNCPMAEDQSEGPTTNAANDDHQAKMRELEAALGFRPLIADKA